MNYHLMIDDKFINKFIVDAEKAAPGNNVYIIATARENAKHVNYHNAVYAPYHTSLFSETVKNIQLTDQVFIHWASNEAIDFVLSLPETIKVGLFFWGGDIVEIPYSIYKSSIYGPFSLKYFERYEERPKVKWNPLKPKRLIRTLGNRYWKYNANEQKLLDIRKAFFKRLNYFFNWNIIDFEWIKAHYETSAVYKYFFYNFEPIPPPVAESNRISTKPHTTILLGNSDTPTNNHLEILEVLKKFKEEPIKIVIPLNYGNKKYGDMIEQRAIAIFGAKKILALRTFMDIATYYQILDEVDIAVMNHYRTQAAGNTLALLYRGKKVYIHEVSSTYKLLKTNKVAIGNSADISKLPFKTFTEPLAKEDIAENIARINQLFNIEEKETVLKLALN